jgi:hypothetical protein
MHGRLAMSLVGLVHAGHASKACCVHAACMACMLRAWRACTQGACRTRSGQPNDESAIKRQRQIAAGPPAPAPRLRLTPAWCRSSRTAGRREAGEDRHQHQGGVEPGRARQPPASTDGESLPRIGQVTGHASERVPQRAQRLRCGQARAEQRARRPGPQPQARPPRPAPRRPRRAPPARTGRADGMPRSGGRSPAMIVRMLSRGGEGDRTIAACAGRRRVDRHPPASHPEGKADLPASGRPGAAARRRPAVQRRRRPGGVRALPARRARLRGARRCSLTFPQRVRGATTRSWTPAPPAAPTSARRLSRAPPRGPRRPLRARLSARSSGRQASAALAGAPLARTGA